MTGTSFSGEQSTEVRASPADAVPCPHTTTEQYSLAPNCYSRGDALQFNDPFSSISPDVKNLSPFLA